MQTDRGCHVKIDVNCHLHCVIWTVSLMTKGCFNQSNSGVWIRAAHAPPCVVEWATSEQRVNLSVVHVSITRIADAGGWVFRAMTLRDRFNCCFTVRLLQFHLLVHCSLCGGCSSLSPMIKASPSAQCSWEALNSNEWDMRGMWEDGGSRLCGVAAPFLGVSIVQNWGELHWFTAGWLSLRTQSLSVCVHTTGTVGVHRISWPHQCVLTVSRDRWGPATDRNLPFWLCNCSAWVLAFRTDRWADAVWSQCTLPRGRGLGLWWLLTESFQPLRFEPMTSQKLSTYTASTVVWIHNALCHLTGKPDNKRMF